MCMRPLLFILVSTVLVVAGCKKEKTDRRPVREIFPLSYQFINEGDANVKSVIFYTTTLYINDTVDVRGDSVTIVNWRDQAFNGVGASDIITMPLDKKGYVGCTGRLNFVIWFKKPVFSPVLFAKGYGGQNGVHPVGMTEGRCYEGPVQSINAAAEGAIKFRWPSDTANYKEVLYLQ